MSDDKLNQLIYLRDQIKNLKVVKCRLNHERILFDKQTNLPIFKNLPEKVYQRIGFCSPEIRRERISCGHTMARYILEEALTILNSEEKNTEILRNELNEATNRIHALDHKKGDAEKRLAELIEQKYSDKDLESAKNDIESIEQQHDDCIEKIADVREQLLTELQYSIENI